MYKDRQPYDLPAFHNIENVNDYFVSVSNMDDVLCFEKKTFPGCSYLDIRD